MNIIIPLGGKGERFKKCNYDKPKPLIKVLDKEILFYVIDNLHVDVNDKIFIIYNKELDDYHFKKIINEKYPYIHLKRLDYDTKGAAETVHLMTEYIIKHNLSNNLKTLLIDGDTFYTKDIIAMFKKCDENAVFYVKNYEKLPIFSYIKIVEDDGNGSKDIIVEIKEKNKISDNANTGAYAFKDINELNRYAKYIIDNNITFNNEFYTSCIIHKMLEDNHIFKGLLLDEKEVYVLGTPEQVNQYIRINM